QPVMYERIKQTPTVRQRYADQLVREGVVDSGLAAAEAEQMYQRLTEVQQSLKANLREAGAGEEPQRISGAQSWPPEPETAATAPPARRPSTFPPRVPRSSGTAARSPNSRAWGSSTVTPPPRPTRWCCGRRNTVTSRTAAR